MGVGGGGGRKRYILSVGCSYETPTHGRSPLITKQPLTKCIRMYWAVPVNVLPDLVMSNQYLNQWWAIAFFFSCRATAITV